jgi:hypothetical protein
VGAWLTPTHIIDPLGIAGTWGIFSFTYEDIMKLQLQKYEYALDEALAPTPTQAEQEKMISLDNIEDRYEYAEKLVKDGVALDVPVHVWGWDYWRAMEQRRVYGYTWIPIAGMENIAVAPGLNHPSQFAYDADNPPAYSLRVPKTVHEDINYRMPRVVDPPPANILKSPGFGPPAESSDFVDAFLVSASNTSPVGAVAEYLGNEYILIKKRRPFSNLKLWVPL